MRLIDADAITYCNYDLDNYHSFRAVEEEEIVAMPTIEAEPVRHGRWVDNNCSECGYPIPTRDRVDFIYEEECHYCYNCGAHMEA